MQSVIQCDQFFIDGTEAWFVDRNENVLYKYDILKNKYDLISMLPSTLPLDAIQAPFYRITPYCYKKENLIFCIPDRGDAILIYDKFTKNISKIDVAKEKNIRLSIHNFWESDNKLWAVSYGLSKILEIDLKKKRIENYYDIFDNSEDLPGYEAEMVNDTVFCISRNSNKISEFNLKTKTKKILEIPGVMEGIYTICYVGDFFWLGGISGKVYLWNKKNEIKEMKNYPKEIKTYGYSDSKSNVENIFLKSKIPIFYKSFSVGDAVCFLPYNHNQLQCDMMLCINKTDYHMWTVKLLEEGRDKRGFYVLEYVGLNNRVGISFSGNDYISEISINENSVKRKYLPQNDLLVLLHRNILIYASVYETENQTLELYERVVQELRSEMIINSQKCGKKILAALLKV